MENIDVERGDIKFDVNETVQSLLNCVRAANKIPPYIHRAAPSTLRNLSPDSFKPRVVAIGPMHRKDKNLQRFEVQKAAFVQRILSRSGDSSTQTLTACVQKVASMIDDIKRSYADMRSYEYDDTELIKMMVMDACFILEFIHEISVGSNLPLQDQYQYIPYDLVLLEKLQEQYIPYDPVLLEKLQEQYIPYDLVLLEKLQEQYIPYDLVLLENQIPFFVLKSIYECTKKETEEHLSITEFILPLVKQIKLFEGRIKVGRYNHSNTNHYHILGYLHHCYRPRKDIKSGFPSSTIHSAVELDRAGVKFKPNGNPNWPLTMEVKRNRSRFFCFLFKATLTMPTLRINDFTELVFRNIIAYEQSYIAHPYVTSYARAMDMLIDTHDDIAKLVRSKVIVNHIGSDEEAANMINRICKGLVPEHFYYTQQWEELDSHFKGYWPRKIEKLKRTYFHSPWSIIALFAGFVLFVLAMLQTIFTIKSS